MSFTVDTAVMKKGWKRFSVMHMDRKVASIREDGTCTIYFPSFMPYNLWLDPTQPDDLDTRLNNLNNFYYWCSSRVLTLDRKYAKEILNSIGAKQAVTDRDRAMIALSYHALSLTDVYWVKSDRENIRFSDLRRKASYRWKRSTCTAPITSLTAMRLCCKRTRTPIT